MFITSRTLDKSVILSKKYKFSYINWDERNGLNCNILINASPIGMNPYQNEIPISFSSIKNMRVVIDVVNKPLHTKLINYCNKNHIKNIPGFELSINQLIKQIYIYTGEKTTYNYIRKILKV